jgi:ubiquinone/menaquinone biosynthesis C-methylase UbiE
MAGPGPRGQTPRMSELAEPVAMVRRMFDTVADDYDQSGVAFFQPIADRLVDLLGVRPGEDALDLGCGRGAATTRLAGTGAHVTAVDLSPAMLAHTRAAVAGLDVTVLEMDATRPTLPEASYDVLASSLVLFFLPDPRDALSRWLRLLRPGGRFGLTTFGKADATFEALGDLFEPYIPREVLDPMNERGQDDPFASPGTLTALAETAGASDVRVVEEDLAVELADVHAWRRWTMSTGQRMFWGRMDDAQRAATMARAEELVESARGADGRVVVRMGVRFTLGRR